MTFWNKLKLIVWDIQVRVQTIATKFVGGRKK